MKRVLYITSFAIMVFILIVLLVRKEDINNFVSEKIKEQYSADVSLTAQELIQKEYNYAQNGEYFDFTLLEFGSTGCAVCKQMEPVLEEIKNNQTIKVNVVFLHIMQPENIILMKYYGISVVPMQILLDKQGNEFFRHYGFIPADELLGKFLVNKPIPSAEV